MKIVCWNMAHSRKSWNELVRMAGVDIALLQEASRLPDELRHDVEVDHRLWPERHKAALGYPSVVARLSNRVSVSFIATLPMGDHFSHDFYTSEWGTLGAAIVTPIDGDEFAYRRLHGPRVQRLHARVGLAESPRVHRLGPPADIGSGALGRPPEPRHCRWRLGHQPRLEHPYDSDLERTRGTASPDSLRPDAGVGLSQGHA